MSNVKDSFLDLEKHRLRLEDNVRKLQKALQHWQIWDAEYEGLKEEVEAISETDEVKDLRRVHDEFDGELLTGKELDEIFGQPNVKTREQIINVLERRIDYVTKNIETLQKQLEAAENKHAAAAVISQPDATDEDGQPITDIIEQLDDDDNVISFQLSTPGDAVSHVEELLDKAGVSDPPASKSADSQKAIDTQVDQGELSSTPKTSLPDPSPKPSEPDAVVKKSVSFSEDTEVVEQPQPDMSFRAKRVEHIMNTAKEQEDISKEAAVIPRDESPEDAALRQQMLKYGMSEVSAVVAELEIEDDSYEESEDDTDEGFDEEYEEDGEEEEDEYGRYKGSVITDRYRQRMLELERKHGLKSHSSRSKSKDGHDSDDNDDERIGRIVVNRQNEALPSSSAPQAAPKKSILKEREPNNVDEKKGVRFAPSLDIAPDNETSAPSINEKVDVVEPLGDIVERVAPSKPVEQQVPKKTSRFKKSRDTTSSAAVVPSVPSGVRPVFVDEERQPAPTGPEGATIADVLVEREASSSAIPPDEFNNASIHQEVADEYQRMRRKFIQRDGGFLKQDESPIQPVDDEESHEPISRFKAARLSRQ